jgi:hypothetical protein
MSYEDYSPSKHPKHVYYTWINYIKETHDVFEQSNYCLLEEDLTYQINECQDDYVRVLEQSGLSYRNCTVALMVFIFGYTVGDVAFYLDADDETIKRRLVVIRDCLKDVGY